MDPKIYAYERLAAERIDALRREAAVAHLLARTDARGVRRPAIWRRLLVRLASAWRRDDVLGVRACRLRGDPE